MSCSCKEQAAPGKIRSSALEAVARRPRGKTLSRAQRRVGAVPPKAGKMVPVKIPARARLAVGERLGSS